MPRKKTYTVVAEFTDHHTGTDLDRLSREPAYQAIIEMELASSGIGREWGVSVGWGWPLEAIRHWMPRTSSTRSIAGSTT